MRGMLAAEGSSAGVARAVLACSVVCLIACGASQASLPPPAHPEAAATPAVRPVPSDPLELVVGVPSAVAVVNVDQVRASALFARVRPLLERAACISSAQLDALLAPTARLIIAARNATDQTEQIEWLAVLVGSYTEQDADRILASTTQSADPALRQPVGRFTLATRAGLATSLLEQRLLVLGTPAWVRSALDSIEQPSPSFAASALWREHGPRVQCAERMVCVLSAADGVIAKRVQRALASAGSKSLGKQLAAADGVVGANAAAGIDLAVDAELQTPEAAADAAQQAKDLFWQAGLLIRLAGLPNVFDAAQVRAEGRQLKLDLSVSANDLAAYQDRLSKLLIDERDQCTPVAAP
jgi:hypothetical protein